MTGDNAGVETDEFARLVYGLLVESIGWSVLPHRGTLGDSLSRSPRLIISLGPIQASQSPLLLLLPLPSPWQRRLSTH